MAGANATGSELDKLLSEAQSDESRDAVNMLVRSTTTKVAITCILSEMQRLDVAELGPISSEHVNARLRRTSSGAGPSRRPVWECASRRSPLSSPLSSPLLSPFLLSLFAVAENRGWDSIRGVHRRGSPCDGHRRRRRAQEAGEAYRDDWREEGRECITTFQTAATPEEYTRVVSFAAS